MYLGNMRCTVRPDKGCPRVPRRQSTPQPPALNAVGGRVFQRKIRARTRACGTRGASGLPPGGMLVLRAWEVRMDAGGPRPLWWVPALDCWLGASPPQGQVASPDPSQSGERVRGRWPGEEKPDPWGPAAPSLMV